MSSHSADARTAPGLPRANADFLHKMKKIVKFLDMIAAKYSRMDTMIISVIILLAMIMAILGGCETSKSAKRERDYSDAWCEARGGDSRAILSDGTKPDCLLENEAVEFDFGMPHKAYECVGQAMHYARMSERNPVCILVQKAGISVAEFARAVWRVSPPVEVRCMNADGEFFTCPKRRI